MISDLLRGSILNEANRFGRTIVFDDESDINEDHYIDNSSLTDKSIGAVKINNKPSNDMFNSVLKLNYTEDLYSLYMGRYKSMIGHEMRPVMVYPAKSPQYNGLFLNVTKFEKEVEMDDVVDIDGIPTNIPYIKTTYVYYADLYRTNEDDRVIKLNKHPDESILLFELDEPLGYIESFIDNDGTECTIIYAKDDTLTVRRVFSGKSTETFDFHYPELSWKILGKRIENQLIYMLEDKDGIKHAITVYLKGSQFKCFEAILDSEIENLSIPSILNGFQGLQHFVSVTNTEILRVDCKSGKIITRTKLDPYYNRSISTNSTSKVICDYNLDNIWVGTGSTNYYISRINYHSERYRMLPAHVTAIDKLENPVQPAPPAALIQPTYVRGVKYYLMGSGSFSSNIIFQKNRFGPIDKIYNHYVNDTYSSDKSVLFKVPSTWTTSPFTSPSNGTATFDFNNSSIELPYFSGTFTEKITKKYSAAELLINLNPNSGGIDGTYLAPIMVDVSSLSGANRVTNIDIDGDAIFKYDINTIYINICKID